MKILLATLLSIFAFTASTLQAQECEPTVTNLRVNPLALVFNGVELGIDAPISETISFGVDVGYVFDTSVFSDVKGTAKGMGLRLSHVPGGLHEDSFISTIGIHGSRLDLKGDVNAKTDVIKGEVSMGYRWVWDSFNTSLTGGLAQVHVKNRELVNGSAKGITPTAELSFGYHLKS